MKRRVKEKSAIVAGMAVLLVFGAGCGNPGGELSMEDIPRYPNAVEGESIKQSSPGGVLEGHLAQFTTLDSFDEVMEFYTDALEKYDPEFLSHTSDLGRQAAVSIPGEEGVISITVQEFAEEGKVNITFMALET